MRYSHHFPKKKTHTQKKIRCHRNVSLKETQILPVGIRRHSATTYAVIRIFVNTPVEKKLYEKLGTVLIIKVSELQRKHANANRPAYKTYHNCCLPLHRVTVKSFDYKVTM